jgi:hypothetical protein
VEHAVVEGFAEALAAQEDQRLRQAFAGRHGSLAVALAK